MMEGIIDEEDFLLSASIEQRGLTPRRGRRSGPLSPSKDVEVVASTGSFETPPGGNLFTMEEDMAPKPPPGVRRTGGWADETLKSAKARRSGSAIPEQKNLHSPTVDSRWKDDSDEEGPAIPDLEEVQEEDLALQVADAPNLAVNRVATYKELDKDLLKYRAFATMDDVDLGILLNCLSPESELEEPDMPWTWDVLFTDVTSEVSRDRKEEDTSDVERALP